MRSLRSFAAIALLLLLFSRPSFAATTNVPAPVFHTSLKAASEAAAADQSLVLLVFSAEWCEPCKQLKARTLDSPEFKQQGGALHIADVDIDAEASVARDYDVQAVPTLFLLTPDHKIIARREGFLYTAELMLWLREGRERVKEGKWEGTAPSSKLDAFVSKAAADQLDAKDLARLVELLGEPNPADRDEAAKLLIDQRETAMVPLIGAITNSYLGIRLAASEALHKLAPDAPQVDPWQAPVELVETAASLGKWWAATGRLLPPHPEPAVDGAATASIVGALDMLRGNDPVERTKAMSALVARGKAALPALREAIQGSEKTGDQRSLGLLEDVRWAILIPDGVEERAGGVRHLLARGKGADRQEAAARLGKAGPEAIPALAELAEDSDPLVVESAVWSLSNIGGKDSLPAMAALLKASDSNLRMTAAQALGHTRDTAATKPLLAVLDDPDEVVACTALSALDELYGERDYSNNRRSTPAELVPALQRCLGEPRWRVRAAAAEVAGKLAVNEVIPDLKRLLDDSDDFVVKTALEALQKMSAAPDSARLLKVAQRQPELRGDVVALLAGWGTDDAARSVAELYQSSPTEGRVAIVRSLATRSERTVDSSVWKVLLTQAATDADPRLRRAVAETLAAQPPPVAVALVDQLLADEDESTRVAAAGVVLSVLGGERQVVTSSHGNSISQFIAPDSEEAGFGSQRRKANPTNAPPMRPAQIEACHATLVRNAGTNADLLTATAIYVTGSSNAGLAALERALAHSNPSSLTRLANSAAVAALLPRLPWPEGKVVIEHLSASPALFLKMTAYLHQGAPGIGQFLLDPARFRAAVEPAGPDELESGLERLLEPQQKGWSLLSASPQATAVAFALLDSTNAGWRAAAVYSLSLRDDPKVRACLEHAVADSNAWVRAAAVAGLARAVPGRDDLERLLAPLMSDPDKRVSELAALGLLQPETRQAAGLDDAAHFFQFEKVQVWTGGYEPNGEQRPLATLPGSPRFLEAARRRLVRGPADAAGPAALLLAQYGDFAGLNQLLKAPDAQDDGELEGVVLTAIGLSHDAKYIPQLKQRFAAAKDEQDYRRLLQALRGMSGVEARELRLAINKRLRQGVRVE